MQSQRQLFLIQAISENSDEKAFDELFRIYYPGLLSYAASILKDRPAAEEICIDVLLKLWQNRSSLPAITNLSKYLYTAAKHASISYMRSKGYKQQQQNLTIEEAGEYFEFELNNQDQKLINKETFEQINQAINSLPDRCRLIFRLIKEEGLKYSEVAELLDISVKTVENQMTIAMKKLTESLTVLIRDRKIQKS